MRSVAASGLSAGRSRWTRPPRNSNSGLMPRRRPAQPAMPGTRPLRTRWSRFGTAATSCTRSTTSLASRLDLVERRAPLRRRSAAASTTSASAPAAVAVSTTRTGRRADRRPIAAASCVPLIAGRDREDEDAVVAARRASMAVSNSPGAGPDVETRSSPSSSLSGRSPSRTDSPPIVSHIGTTVIRCLATSSAGRAAALSVTMATVTAPAAGSRYGRRARRRTSSPEHRSTTRDGSSRPISGQVTAPSRAAARPAPTAASASADPDHDVERGEREDALAARRAATAARPSRRRA